MIFTRRFIKVSALGLTLGLTAAQADPTVTAAHQAVTVAANVATDRLPPLFGAADADVGSEAVRIANTATAQGEQDDNQEPAPWLLAGAGAMVILSAARRRSL